jgi:putative transcriptional regulator
MKEELFRELVESIRQGGRILRGESPASRRTEVSDPDVAAIRESYNLSQEQFAMLLGISVRTLQNWEQGRRRPQGAARVLLRVAEQHPDAVLDAVQKAS